VDLQMCKYLVEHGADVTITEKDGMRPYSIAVEKGDMEMAEYFKSLEPTEFHDLQNKMDQLKPFKLPKALVNFLDSELYQIYIHSLCFLLEKGALLKIWQLTTLM